MFFISYFPPIWYKVMDKRLLEHAGYDARNINFDPDKREKLIRKYGIKHGDAPPKVAA